MAKVEYLTELVLATGALGTAAFGLVEAQKATAAVGEAGFDEIPRMLGALTHALERAHGTAWERVFRGLYRGDADELVRMLRQGVRVGLTSANAAAIGAELFGADTPEVASLVQVADKALSPSRPPTDAELHVLGRYELMADARIDAAVALAKQRYAATARVRAMWWAFGIALGTAVAVQLLPMDGMLHGVPLFVTALLVGVAAVPIAPIAKDVASGIQAAARALRSRS
jgi:hypothetical protein